MSIENRPNLNAVGLLIDIQTAIERNIRGSATEANLADILVLVHKVFLPAIEEFDSQLDQRFPGQKESFTKEEFHHIWVEVHNGRGHHGSFLRNFASVYLLADALNTDLLAPVSEQLIRKYDLHKYLDNFKEFDKFESFK